MNEWMKWIIKERTNAYMSLCHVLCIVESLEQVDRGKEEQRFCLTMNWNGTDGNYAKKEKKTIVQWWNKSE